MEYHNKVLCVTREELIGGENPVIKEGTLNSNVSRKNIICVSRGGGEGGYALYSYDSMPQKYKDRFMEKYGDPRRVIREREMSEAVKLDEKARTWLEEYRYVKSDGEETPLDEETKAEYLANASVMNELLRMKRERRALMSSLNARASDVWQVVLENSERLRARYHHTLPASGSRLKARLRAYEKKGYASLVSGKLGNRNTVKLTDEGRKIAISLKRSQTPRYTDVQIFAKYNEIAALRGLKPLKNPGALTRWFNTAAIQPLWWDAVYGEQAAREKFGRKQKTLLPTKRDALWYGDGTKLNLYYRDARGKVRTTGVYEVVDAMSEVLLGYHISDTEDFNAQYHAFRMAIRRAGHKPYEIVHDNQGGHKKLNRKQPASSSPRTEDAEEMGFLDRICHIHRPTMPYHGESKTIEHVFGRFQQQVLARYFNFTGQNVTAKMERSRPNVEMVMENRDRLPTYEELCEIYAECREEWNEMVFPGTEERRIDRYEKSVNDATDVVGPLEMQDIFWVMSDKPVTFTDYGIRMTVDKKKYQWEVFDEKGMPDLEWRRKHTWEKFYVQYDPDDMTSVILYSIDLSGKKHRARVAKPYLDIHRAMQEQSAAEKAMIHSELEREKQERIERVVAGRRIAMEHGTDPSQNGLRYPKLKGLTKEQQAQVEERLGRLEERKPKAETVELGRYTKELSNRDWLQVDERKMAEKL